MRTLRSMDLMKNFSRYPRRKLNLKMRDSVFFLPRFTRPLSLSLFSLSLTYTYTHTISQSVTHRGSNERDLGKGTLPFWPFALRCTHFSCFRSIRFPPLSTIFLFSPATIRETYARPTLPSISRNFTRFYRTNLLSFAQLLYSAKILLGGFNFPLTLSSRT